MWARIMKTPTSQRVTARPMGFVRSAWRALGAAREMGLPLGNIVRAIFSQPERIRLLAHFGAAMPYVERATLQGDAETGIQFIGQAQGLVDDLPSVADLIQTIVDEAAEARGRLATLEP